MTWVLEKVTDPDEGPSMCSGQKKAKTVNGKIINIHFVTFLFGGAPCDFLM